MNWNSFAVSLIAGVIALAAFISITTLLAVGAEVPQQFYDALTFAVPAAIAGAAAATSRRAVE